MLAVELVSFLLTEIPRDQDLEVAEGTEAGHGAQLTDREIYSDSNEDLVGAGEGEYFHILIWEDLFHQAKRW